ncbi:MAG: hypothetical protein J7J20_01500 [Desulfurococcales archaeon]|nr:hypothetical protein [Desulfurococcales archaeon]MCD6278604.1 hypothetical protein [Desulfurococcales archaeon]
MILVWRNEESSIRYVEGAIISALRLKRFWRRRGLSEDEAMKRAVKQAIGMIKVSGLSERDVISTLKELKRMTESVLEQMGK